MTSNPAAMLKMAALAALLLLLLIVACGSLYTVDEREYALSLRFGEVNAVRTEPGLYVKMPMVDSVQRIDRRTLRADIPPREVPDRDKERLIIDVVIRYRIVDPVQFRKTLRDEGTALERLKDITYSALRNTIGQHDRTEVIGARLTVDETGQGVFDADGLPVYEPLAESRREISGSIQSRIAEDAASQKFGLTIISAHIKRADFPNSVEDTIIARLTEERKRVAADHRARGEEEYRRRTASVDRQAAELLAEAERDARIVRGEGEAEAIRLVRDALLQDEEFYRFVKSLEAYRSFASGITVVTFAREDELFGHLLGPPPAEPGGVRGQLPMPHREP